MSTVSSAEAVQAYGRLEAVYVQLQSQKFDRVALTYFDKTFLEYAEKFFVVKKLDCFLWSAGVELYDGATAIS